jgi:hypothetical protein
MGSMFSSQSARPNASMGVSTNASTGVSTNASIKGPGPDLSQYTYATKSQLSAKIKNGNFNPETDFDKMTVDNTNPKIGKTYGYLSDDVEKKLEDRIFQLFPNEQYMGGARKRRGKTRKIRKGKKSRKNNKK